MDKITFFALFFILSFNIDCFSQNWNISGKIVDSNNESIDATEVILSINNKPIISELTTESGEFIFKGIEPNTYSILIKQLGDTLYFDHIKLFQDVNLGIITTKLTSKQLPKIVVVGQKKLIERRNDRLVFNVQNSVFATGTSATEILKNVPRIDPSSETLKIIGKSKVLVMINDRLLNLESDALDHYLKTLSSENIAKIEVITNPSAKYDADGNSGLVNIVLKNKSNMGFDGSLTSTFIQRTKAGFMPSSNLNYSNKNLSIGLNFFGDKETKIEDRDIDFVFEDLLRFSKNKKEYTTKAFSSGLNVNYSFEKSDIGIVVNTDWWKVNTELESKVKFRNIKNQIDSTQNLPSGNNEKYNFTSISPYYDIALDTLGKKLKLNYNYITTKYDDHNTIITQNYIGDFEQLDKEYSAFSKANTNYTVNTLNADIEAPFKNFKLETGIKYSHYKNDSDIKFFDVLNKNNNLNKNKSNHFISNEDTYAVYLSLKKQWSNKFFTKAGLRYENTRIKGNSITIDTIFINRFDNIFPNIFISYEPNDNNSFSLGYNKRIDRPRFDDINPFKTYTNSYEYSEGNPQLAPSITHNIEFSYTLKNNFTATSYFYLLKDGSEYVTTAFQDSSVIKAMPQNYLEKKVFGLNASYNWNITTNLSSYSSIDFQYSRSKSKMPQLTTASINGNALFFSTRNSYRILENIQIYLNYYYFFPSTDGFWEAEHSSNTTLGGVFNIPKQNLYLNISIGDIFKTSRAKGKQVYTNFTRKTNSYHDQRNLRISLTYKFGNKKSKSVDRQIDDTEKSRVDK